MVFSLLVSVKIVTHQEWNIVCNSNGMMMMENILEV